MKISVVVPAFNEEKRIARSLRNDAVIVSRRAEENVFVLR